MELDNTASDFPKENGMVVMNDPIAKDPAAKKNWHILKYYKILLENKR